LGCPKQNPISRAVLAHRLYPGTDAGRFCIYSLGADPVRAHFSPTHSTHDMSRPLVGVLLLLSFGAPLNAQTQNAIIAITPRVSTGLLLNSDLVADSWGIGLDLEVVPSWRVSPTLRLESWSFGISCVGVGPCPSAVDLVTLGARVRLAETASPVIPYVGVEVGRMWWIPDTTGWSARARVGTDIRLLRPLDLRLDGGYTRFFDPGLGEQGMVDDQLFAASAGLRIRL
jgi:hypothetical protein